MMVSAVVVIGTVPAEGKESKTVQVNCSRGKSINAVLHAQ
jgi:hypothetical protein